jgi:glutathione S-transferase
VVSRTYAIWGSELSPFVLKVIALCRYAEVETRLLPNDGTLLENLDAAFRVERIKRGKLPLTYPRMSELDEFPLTPFMLGDGGENLFDSSAIAHWLDARFIQPGAKLIPEDPVLAFSARLIDEYFDEFGLYLVHHNRWVTAAHGNDAGDRLANEYRTLVPGLLRARFSRWFSARQTRRLPYLFSVADPEKHITGLGRERQPPAREGFRPTHAFLDDAFARLLAALEGILTQSPYLLGDRLTLADTSAYGQLCMNTQDLEANELIARRAPATHAWIERIERGELEPGHASGSAVLRFIPELDALHEEICRTFVPLMRQNEAAYERHVAVGETLFNESAFDRHRALYKGTIGGQSFRSVAKTFQVKVWRRLLDHWWNLTDEERDAFPAFAQAISDGAD